MFPDFAKMEARAEQLAKRAEERHAENLVVHKETLLVLRDINNNLAIMRAHVEGKLDDLLAELENPTNAPTEELPPGLGPENGR